MESIPYFFEMAMDANSQNSTRSVNIINQDIQYLHDIFSE